MTKIRMISIEGMDHAIVGTGISSSGKEVLVYDGNVFESELSIRLVLQNLTDTGHAEIAPLFVYLDKDIGAEAASAADGNVYH